MPTEITNQLQVLEKPLKFASGNSFKNLNKVKNLEKVIGEITLKIVSEISDDELKKKLSTIKESFKNFEKKTSEDKISIINSALDSISKLNTKTSENKNKAPVQNDSTKYNEIKPSDPVRYLKGVGPRISELLSKKDIHIVEDLLFYFPRKYEDRRNLKKISAINKMEKVVIRGTIVDLHISRLRKRKIYNVVITDGTGTLNLLWFTANEKYLKKTYIPGAGIIVSGEVSYNSYGKNLQIIHPKPEDVEIYSEDEDSDENTHFGRIVPIYPLTEGLTQKRIRTIVKLVVEQFADNLKGLLPEEVISSNNLSILPDALREVQFPENSEKIIDLESSEDIYSSRPHKTISFYEFFLLEVGLSLKKKELINQKGISFSTGGTMVNEFIKNLPFETTPAQKRVIEEIEKDMKSPFPMNRLLQGDVGSGKTVVSIISMLNAIENGYQAVLMAPTEILCEQHYRSIKNMLAKLGIKTVLLKSSIKAREKKAVNASINNGEAQLIIGTHALIEENVVFHKLGFVVIDEQHRFGVLQRAKLMDKGRNPDVLVMTATPIPRTLAITVYGDLEISVIDELPPGRKEIKTKLYKENKKNRALIYKTIKEELEKGRQCYVVCPFIDESENPDFQHIKYATNVYESLKTEIFPEFEIGMLHGRMDNEDKDIVMNAFQSNDIQLLVSTTVVEVGVDVPNATVMLIENSERYGLSQLHQLRGRIGRGADESICLLVADYALSENADYKLDIMTKTNDGFRIAEADLKLRGPGDFLGTKQSGIPTFKFANLIRDWKILSEARESALKLVSGDPELKSVPELKKVVQRKWSELLDLNLVS